MVKDGVKHALALALLLDLVSPQNRKWRCIGQRLDMLMKMKPRDARKQTLTDNVAGQVQDGLVVRTSVGVGRFTGRLKVEFSHIDAAQQPVSEFRLIDQLFASFKRQWRSWFILRDCQSSDSSNQSRRARASKAGSEISQYLHLK